MQAVAEMLKQIVDNPKSTFLNEPTQAHLTVVPKHEPPALPDKWAQRIFMRMSAIYGHLWTSRHGTEDTWEIARREWAQALAGLTAEQLDHGIVQCRTHHKMPPTLPEFSELCRQHIPSHIQNDAQLEYERKEKLEEQRTKNYHNVLLATSSGWGYRNYTAKDTFLLYYHGDLHYAIIKDDIEKFLAHDKKGSLAELI